MKLVLTGGTGLVGGAILRRLLADGHRVTMATSSKGIVSTHANLTIVPWNLNEAELSPLLLGELAACDGVVHAAAVMTPEPPGGLAAETRLYRQNVFGSQTLMVAAVEAEVRSFVCISTANLFALDTAHRTEHTLPAPPSLYAASKLAVEQLAEQLTRMGKTAFSSLRISAPYGPGYRTRSVIPLFVEKARAGDPLALMGSGRRKQVFTYVDDIADAVVCCLESAACGVYNVAGPGPVTMEELAHAILAVMPDTQSRIEWADQPDPQEGREINVDLTRARTMLGWSPAFGIQDGVAAMVRELSNQPSPPYRLSC